MNDEIEELINKQVNNKLNRVNKNLYLRDEDIYILNKYRIAYQQCATMKEIIILINIELEGITNIDEMDDLSLLSQRIEEFYNYNMSQK